MSDYLVKGRVEARLISEKIEEAGRLTNCGGHDIFLGQVRDDMVEGRKVTAIEYSAYEPMVTKEADRIRGTIQAEFPGVGSVIIVHSEGVVRAGEISLFVMISAGHRVQAIEACRKTVELIKEGLPVWKKEIFSDSSHRWTANGASDKLLP
ncbi:MAG TPA: molybdenum cofactor biosynthesis protein MoaE [Bacteroidales bacterium]|nr:molybdenum cofactor biosynthesis protein MoaE [Bacteroidales bacterium]